MVRATSNKTGSRKRKSRAKRGGNGAGRIGRIQRLAEQYRRLEHEIQLYQALGNVDARKISVDRQLSLFLSKAMRFFEASAGTLLAVDPGSGELTFQVTAGKVKKGLKGRHRDPTGGVAGRVARAGKPRLVKNAFRNQRYRREAADVAGFPVKDVLAVPIFTRGGEIIGVIELLNDRKHGGFRREDLQHLTTISGATGNLLENTLLLTEARRRNRHLELLHEVGYLVNSSLDPNEVHRRAIEAIMKLADSEAASLLLFDRATNELFFEVALGAKEIEVRRVRLGKNEGIAGWVIKHGEPLLIDDCRSDPRWSKRMDRESSFVTRNMICVPVSVKGETIGAIQAINKRKGRFDGEEVEMLSILSSQIGVALENARLFDQLRRAFYQTSEALADAIEVRDAYTGGHTRRVTEHSLAVGRRLGMSPIELEQLRAAAILHDIGKLGVDDQVLRKPGRLEGEEIEQMQRHPKLGVAILDQVHYLSDILPGIRYHHERADGNGYPEGLSLGRIPLIARVIAVADTYDAMTSDRPYRKGMRKSVAVREIADCSGSQFDPRVVDAFLESYRAGEITGRRERLPGGVRARAGEANRRRSKKR
jgi:HD-GYP domain-containing protein (c-di-GMP phosphodiesterase class II)